VWEAAQAGLVGAKTVCQGSTSSTLPNPGSGPSMKNISTVMSGSMWACEIKAVTLRPVRDSIVYLYRSAITSWNCSRMATTRPG
jgi:hypothetical protein